MAVQMLYQSALGEESAENVVAAFNPVDFQTESSETGEDDYSPAASKKPLLDREDRQALPYAKTLVEGTLANCDQIDELLRQQTEHWRLERMPAVDRSILRLAVYEFLYERDVPKLVILDEAIELAKKFGSEQSGRFVNGLLDGLLKQHTFPGRMK